MRSGSFPRNLAKCVETMWKVNDTSKDVIEDQELKFVFDFVKF